MSRGLSTVNQLKVIHNKCCSLYSANITRKCTGSTHSGSAFSQFASPNNLENNSYSIVRKDLKNGHGLQPYLALDLNFVRHLSTGQKRYEAAGGSPPDGTSGGSTTSGDGGSSDDRLVCPKCGSPCEHVNAFVAATR